jgi:hypothetical protein
MLVSKINSVLSRLTQGKGLKTFVVSHIFAGNITLCSEEQVARELRVELTCSALYGFIHAQLKVRSRIWFCDECSQWTFSRHSSMVNFTLNILKKVTNNYLAVNASLLRQTFFGWMRTLSWASRDVSTMLVLTDAFKYRQRVFP